MSSFLVFLQSFLLLNNDESISVQNISALLYLLFECHYKSPLICPTQIQMLNSQAFESRKKTKIHI